MKFKRTATLTTILFSLLSQGCQETPFTSSYFLKSQKTKTTRTTYYIYDPEAYEKLKKEEMNYTKIKNTDYTKQLFSGNLDTLFGPRKVEFLELNRKGKKSYIIRVKNPSWTYSMWDKNADHIITPYKDVIMKKYPQEKHFKTIKPDWTNNYYFYTRMDVYYDSLIKKFKEKGIIK